MEDSTDLIFNEKLSILIRVEVRESGTDVKTIGMKACLWYILYQEMKKKYISHRLIQYVE